MDRPPQTVKLTDLYSLDELNDETELLYHSISPEDFNRGYRVKTMRPRTLMRLGAQHEESVYEAFNDCATPAQHRLVRRKMAKFDEKRIVVVTRRLLLDGYHHVVAAINLNKPVKYIDLATP
jgi:hypothetical protein